MNLPPPPQDDDPIITQFKPIANQWELTDKNIKRVNPETGQTILHNYSLYLWTTPLEVYRYLIETKGCDVNARDNNNDTPLHDALCYFEGGDTTVLMYLLTQTNINVNIKGRYGYTILHYARYNINRLPLDVFKLLIETHGADVNAQDEDNETPVHLAFRCFDPDKGGDITVLAYLINQKNVNLNVKGKKGFNLLHYACTNNLPGWRHSAQLNAEFDTIFCQIIEMIAERCVEQILGQFGA
jgi:hypothetical protein